MNIGNEVTHVNIRQSAIKYAIQGNATAPPPKENPKAEFAANVRYLGPMYSRTEKTKGYVLITLFYFKLFYLRDGSNL